MDKDDIDTISEQITELEEFHKMLKKYEDALENPDSILPKEKPKSTASFLDSYLKEDTKKTKEQQIKRLVEEQREELVRKSGWLKRNISDITGKEIGIEKWGRAYDIWSTGLAANPSAQINFDCLNACIDVTNEAIGILEKRRHDWVIGLFEKPIKVSKKQVVKAAETPKAFIAHEGETRALTILKEYLEALGIQYFIAELKASAGRSIEKQVDWTQSNADFAICLATKGKAINKKTGKYYMGLNVADELGRARQVYGDKVILLIQKGVEVHTNIREIVYEYFTTTNMERAFIKIAKELRNWGYI